VVDQPIPEFTIDLDLPPVERFQEVARSLAPHIVTTFDLYMTQVPAPIVKGFEYTAWLWDLSQHEKYQEIKGIVEAIDHPSLTMSKAVLVNGLYELEAWCTSIIAKQADGTIIHSRNLDFDNASVMRDITYKARFERGGEYVFDAVMFGGVMGVYTGMRAGAFSISENERQFDTDYKGLAENVAMMYSGYTEISWAIRDTLTTCDTYECAYKKLSTADISALGYIILAGTKGDEGVVMTRDRFGVAHEEHLNETDGTWFLVQTNNDHWDTGCYNRCAAATEKMTNLSQAEVSPQTIRNSVLYEFPNLNHDTIYNTLFVPITGEIETKLMDYQEEG
jgi:hypothetical protein